MSWSIRPKFPTGTTFDGEITWTSTDIEIPDNIYLQLESTNIVIGSQFVNKNTGFEKKKYKKHDNSYVEYSIMLVGNLPYYLKELLLRLAAAVNGAGMILEFKDNWCMGTINSPIQYECRWTNAGDFVENSELLCGGSIKLLCFRSVENEGSGDPSGGVYEKTIDAPLSGFEWDLKIDDSDADYIYVRLP